MKHNKQLTKSRELKPELPQLAVEPLPKKKKTSTCDARLKRNVRALRGSLAKLLRLRGVSFEYNELGQKRGCPAGERPGFIAQEVEDVMPQWVEYDADGYRRIAIEGFEGLAVEALRELKTENDRLRADLADLRAQVRELAEERQAAAF